MTGRHSVKVFRIKLDEEVNLPEGWKPFGVGSTGIGYVNIVARKWERTGE